MLTLRVPHEEDEEHHPHARDKDLDLQEPGVRENGDEGEEIMPGPKSGEPIVIFPPCRRCGRTVCSLRCPTLNLVPGWYDRMLLDEG